MEWIGREMKEKLGTTIRGETTENNNNYYYYYTSISLSNGSKKKKYIRNRTFTLATVGKTTKITIDSDDIIIFDHCTRVCDCLSVPYSVFCGRSQQGTGAPSELPEHKEAKSTH